MVRSHPVSALALCAALAAPFAAAGCPGCTDDPPVVPPAALAPSVTVAAGTVGRGFVDGVGEDARFEGPAGFAVSPDGATAYVADTFVGTVRAVDVATRAVTTILGAPFALVAVDGAGGPGGDARFGAPRGLAVSPDGGVLWVGDGPSLRRVDLATLEVTTVAGDPNTPGFADGPGADAAFGFLLHDLEDDGARVYATDRVNDVVRAIDVSGADGPAGAFTVRTIADGFDGPGGLTRDGATLYVADTFNGAVVSLDLTALDALAPGAFLEKTVVASGLDDPQGVELVPDGGNEGRRALWTLGFGAVVERIDLDDGPGEVSRVFTGDPFGVIADGAPGDGNLGGTFASLGAVAGGALFIDLSSSAVRKIGVDGAVVTVAGPVTPFGDADGAGAAAKFTSPFALTATSDGTTFYVADTINHAIRAVDVTRSGAAASDTLSYEVRTLVRGEGDADGALGDARVRFPVGLALDEDAQLLYFADSGNQRIRVIDLDAGTVRALAGSGRDDGLDGDADSAGFADPWDLALDVAGNKLYVADSSGNTVRRVDTQSGDVETVLGAFGDNDHVDGAQGASRIRVPVGVAFVPGTLYVSDFEAHTIRALDTETLEATTVHGEDGVAGVADGEAAFALLASPSGMAAAADGSAVFVAETDNHVVRRIAVGSHASRFVVGRAAQGGGQATGRAVPYDEATLLGPEDVAVAAHVAGALDLVVLSDNAVVHAVSVPP